MKLWIDGHGKNPPIQFGEPWHIARSYLEAINLLATTSKYDILSLEYDLNPENPFVGDGLLILEYLDFRHNQSDTATPPFIYSHEPNKEKHDILQNKIFEIRKKVWGW